MQEQWRDVKGYEGLYQISNYGNLKSLDRWRKGKNGSKCFERGRLRKPSLNKHGRYVFGLCKDAKYRHITRYRLVAQAFIPNPENKPQINHLNGIKTDDFVGNLEWSTRTENMRHARALGLFPKDHNQGEKHGRCKLSFKDVKKIRALCKTESVESLAKRFDMSESYIRLIITKKARIAA